MFSGSAIKGKSLQCELQGKCNKSTKQPLLQLDDCNSVTLSIIKRNQRQHAEKSSDMACPSLLSNAVATIAKHYKIDCQQKSMACFNKLSITYLNYTQNNKNL